MSETETGSPAKVARRSLAGPLTGMTCAMVGVLALCCAGDYIFLVYPGLNEIRRSMDVIVPWSSRLITTYGVWLWFATAAGGVLSLDLAFRRPGRASTLVLNVTMCVSALGLAFLANVGAWSPLINLLQGFGTEK